MERLAKVLTDYGLKADNETMKKFEGYMKDILELNQHINLTAIKEEEQFIEKHYIDSLAICPFKEIKDAETILDLGTGAGFPGIPLAIVFPDKQFVLVDSLNKRLKIIQELCEKYDIHNVKVVHGRAEELARKSDYRETFDVCVSRAVAYMPVLTEYCLPFVKVGGCFVSYKGPEVYEEINKAKNAIGLLGGKLNKLEEVEIAGSELNHNLVFITKEKKTDKRFPRKAGTPSKEPLE